jgi:hypothetical protein
MSKSITDDVRVLRLLGLIIVVVYTCLGVLLLADGEGATRALGLVLVLTGVSWLAVDVLRRRGVI